MEMENSKNEIEIDIGALIRAILNKAVIIILVGILTGGLAFVYTEFFVPDRYTSTTQVYILAKLDANQKSLTSTDLAAANYLAPDYQVLLTSRPVLQEVKDELNLEQTIEQLSSMISVELIEDTRIMKISVTTTDPKLSQLIANKVRNVANSKTKEVITGIEAVNAVDDADLPTAPVSPSLKKNTLIGFLGGAGIVVLVVAIMFVMDDTIKTSEDIENQLGISVLGAIPVRNANAKGYEYDYGYGHPRKKNKKNKKGKE